MAWIECQGALSRCAFMDTGAGGENSLDQPADAPIANLAKQQALQNCMANCGEVASNVQVQAVCKAAVCAEKCQHRLVHADTGATGEIGIDITALEMGVFLTLPL